MLAQNLMTCHNLWRDASYTCLPLLFEDTCFGNPGSYGPCNSVGSSAQSDALVSASAGGTFTFYPPIGHLEFSILLHAHESRYVCMYVYTRKYNLTHTDNGNLASPLFHLPLVIHHL